MKGREEKERRKGEEGKNTRKGGGKGTEGDRDREERKYN